MKADNWQEPLVEKKVTYLLKVDGKLEYVKEAAVHALRLLTEQDRISVVIYDDEVELLSPSRAVETACWC